MKREKLISLICAASFIGAGVGYLIDRSDIPALTLPITREGVVLYLDSPTQDIVKHEKVHQQQIERLGQVEFIFEYIRHPCELELQAGANLAHPVCVWENNVGRRNILSERG